MIRTTAVLTLLGLLVSVVAATPVAASTATRPVTFRIARDFNAGTDLWSASGAIADAGTFVDDAAFAGASLTLHGTRTFVGSGGTLTTRYDVRLVATTDPNVFDVTGHWTVLRGTGIFGSEAGTGPIAEVFDAAAGTVSGVWSGFVVGPS
jgi:hypothetical protein